EIIYDSLDQFFLMLEAFIGYSIFPKKRLRITGAMLQPPVCMLHDKLSRLAKDGVIGIEARPDGAPAVAGGRLNIQLFNRRFTYDSSVCNTVKGDPSRHTKPLDAKFFVNRSGHIKQDLFGDGLDTRGNVCVMLVLFAKLIIISGLIPEVRWIAGVGREKQSMRVAWRTE